jgi:hypothetical protein
MQTRKNNIYFQISKVCDSLDIMKIFLKTKCMDMNVLIDKTPINYYTIPNEHFKKT